MLKYIALRLLQVIPMLLAVSILVFGMLQLAPYDAIDSLRTPNMSPEQLELLRQRHGLDEPVHIQYLHWIGNVLQGDLGNSLVTQQPIGASLAVRIPNTMWLVLPAYLTALVLAIVLGLIAGANRGRWLDRTIDSLSSIGLATPPFWFALLLIYLLGHRLGLLPILGMYSLGKEGDLLDLAKHFVMPYLVLVFAFTPDLTRYVRASTAQQLDEDYVLVQRAFGATRGELFGRHVVRNVLLPVVTQIGLALPLLVTGAIITESIFSWPGVGPYFLSGTRALDYPVILAVLLLSATLVILGNLLADVLYVIIDPRVRLGGAA